MAEKPIVIFGTSDISQLADFYFRSDLRREVVAFTVDSEFISGPLYLDRPLVQFSKVAELYPPDKHDLFVAVSYAKMNRLRANKAAAARSMGYSLPSYISPRATVLTDQIGDNAFILEDNTIQPFVKIGDNVMLWSGNHIGHHSILEDNVFISSHVVVSGGVRIGKNSFLGVNATIVDHLTLGAYSLIGAGALIMKDTEDESVYVSPSPAEKRGVKSTRLPKI